MLLEIYLNRENLKEYRDKLPLVDLHISMDTRLNGYGCMRKT